MANIGGVWLFRREWHGRQKGRNGFSRVRWGPVSHFLRHGRPFWLTRDFRAEFHAAPPPPPAEPDARKLSSLKLATAPRPHLSNPNVAPHPALCGFSKPRAPCPALTSVIISRVPLERPWRSCAGAAYITGVTSSSNFPRTNRYRARNGGLRGKAQSADRFTPSAISWGSALGVKRHVR